MTISTALKMPLHLCGGLAVLALAACQTASTESTTAAALDVPEETVVELAYTPAEDGRPFADTIARHAEANDVPVDLAHAVVYSESTYRPGVTGAAGEVGLMQIKLPTARMMGYTGSRQGLYDPETNIKYGMRYLGEARRIAGGTTCGTILRYNAGHAATRMNPISRAYCDKVLNIMDDS